MSDFEWIDDISVDPTTFFNVGSEYHMDLIYGSKVDHVAKFIRYDRDVVCCTYEDGRGVLYFDGHSLTPLYIESQLEELGLTLCDLF